MHVHLPKPLHGWREFAGEVGVIVLGVLIALTAEQFVEQWRWRQKIREATAQLDAELHQDAASAYQGLVVAPCNDRQLDAIDMALASARKTGRLQPTPAFVPPLHLFTEDSWLNARSLQIADHLSSKQIREYSRLFFYLRDLEAAVPELHKEAAELRPLRPGLSPISADEVGAYQRDVGQIHELLERVELGETLLLGRLKAQGIAPTTDEMKSALQENRSWAGGCVAPPDFNRDFPNG